MKNEFITYEQAVKLKELGFDKECIAWYSDGKLQIDGLGIKPNHYRAHHGVLAPLYQQVFKWFMDRHKLYGIIIPTINMYWTFKIMTVTQDMVEIPPYKEVDSIDYNLYESAELACLKKLIEIVK